MRVITLFTSMFSCSFPISSPHLLAWFISNACGNMRQEQRSQKFNYLKDISRK